MSIIYLPGLIGLLINCDDSSISWPGSGTPHPLEFQHTSNSPSSSWYFRAAAATDGEVSEAAELQQWKKSLFSSQESNTELQD